MKILIIGDGKVGYNLAENLSKDEENEVTIIDRKSEVLRETMENLDVRCIQGDGVNLDVLNNAGIAGSDLVISATSTDEMNIVCSLMAKKLGANYTITRIRDKRYSDVLGKLDFGLDMIINPEMAVADDIANLLAFPDAVNADAMAKGKAEIVEIKVTDNLAIAGKTLMEVGKKFSENVLVGAILRKDDIIIPNGSSVITAGDTIYLVGRPSSIVKFCRQIGMLMRKIKNVMIVGGGRVAYHLARYLDEVGTNVKIIEINPVRCKTLSEMLPDTLIINEDGSSEKILRIESVQEMDAFVSVTGMDEENLMTAMLAKYAGVPKVIAKISRPGYDEVIAGMGLENIINPKNITSAHILRCVRGLKNAQGNAVETLYPLANERAEAIEFTANETCLFLDKPLKSIKLAGNILVAGIVRKNDVIIPHGNDAIKLRDSVILITKDKIVENLNDILAN
jgi:trk system potassium uptake protein TrkA